MAPPAAPPLRRQLDLEIFEKTVCKIFDVFGVRHDVKTADGEAVELDMDVRHVLNHLLAEQEALFRQWQFEEAWHFQERLGQLDRSWQRRCKAMPRGSARNIEIPASLQPGKAKEVEVKATEDPKNTAAEEGKEEARKQAAEEEAKRTAAEEERKKAAEKEENKENAQSDKLNFDLKTKVEEEARRQAAEEEAKRTAAEKERNMAAEEEENKENAQSDKLNFDLKTKVEDRSAHNTASFTASFKEPTEEPQARQDSGEKIALEYTSRTQSGKDLEATPSRKDDASKRMGYTLTSSTPATSPSKSPLTGARGPPASPAATPPKQLVAESPSKPRNAFSEGMLRLMGKFGGGSR